MAAIKHDTRTGPGDCSREVLDLVHGWLGQPAGHPYSLAELARDLAAAFRAPAAGAAVLADGAPLVREPAADGQPPLPPLPWAGRPERLAPVRQAASAVVVRSEQGQDF